MAASHAVWPEVLIFMESISGRHLGTDRVCYFVLRRAMAQQTVTQLFQKWIDCNQSLRVSASGEKSKRSAWKPSVRNPFASGVCFQWVVDLDSTFIPLKLRLAVMSLSGLWEAAFLSLKVTSPPTWTCFITDYKEHRLGSQLPQEG